MVEASVRLWCTFRQWNKPNPQKSKSDAHISSYTLKHALRSATTVIHIIKCLQLTKNRQTHRKPLQMHTGSCICLLKKLYWERIPGFIRALNYIFLKGQTDYTMSSMLDVQFFEYAFDVTAMFCELRHTTVLLEVFKNSSRRENRNSFTLSDGRVQEFSISYRIFWYNKLWHIQSTLSPRHQKVFSLVGRKKIWWKRRSSLISRHFLQATTQADGEATA